METLKKMLTKKVPMWYLVVVFLVLGGLIGHAIYDRNVYLHKCVEKAEKYRQVRYNPRIAMVVKIDCDDHKDPTVRVRWLKGTTGKYSHQEDVVKLDHWISCDPEADYLVATTSFHKEYYNLLRNPPNRSEEVGLLNNIPPAGHVVTCPK
ncbi:hypothetical protein KJ785_02990 [Patescibacteria group bacterium]|nr:hypothetical protein [Patescibacteria group bacterium]